MSESRMGVIAYAMAGGLTFMVGLIAWSHLAAAGRVPTANQLRVVNSLTTIAMVAAVIAIVVSEILWRWILRRTREPLRERVLSAFIARVACREGAALLGMTVAYIAASGGVLHAYPAYWANLAPYALFLVFLATHWPSAEKLAADADAVLREVTNVTF